MLRPDSDSTLADGVVVETRLTARLLGVKLLRVDGVVLLSPGRVERAVPGAPRTGGRATTGSLSSLRLAHGEALVRAAELLEQSDAHLRRVDRANGTTRRARGA